jgi:hypothetical protein
VPRNTPSSGSYSHAFLTRASSPAPQPLSLFVDESPEFHNPYSDLSLFLYQTMKEEIVLSGHTKKWSTKLQEKLLQTITPEFQRKFPQYRLSISGLRKIWDKITDLLEQIAEQKEALSPEGTLNLSFWIREHLRQFVHLYASHPAPYHWARHLAIKISECMVIIDGTRTHIDHLSKMIWSVQKHLITPSHGPLKTPYDERDPIDPLIAKLILEKTTQDPHITLDQLEHYVQEALEGMRELPTFHSIEWITCSVSALLAEKLYPSCRLHTAFTTEEKKALLQFIESHRELCRNAGLSFTDSEVVRRIIALYRLACQLPKNISKEELKQAILAVYPLYRETELPPLPQMIYAFISAQCVLMKTEEYCYSKDFVVNAIIKSYDQVRSLPLIDYDDPELLDLITWKILSERERFLEKLPYRVGLRIEEAIADVVIDNPKLSFSSCSHRTVQLFKRNQQTASLKKEDALRRRISLWSIQNDMLCHCLRLDHASPLLQIIMQKLEEKGISHPTRFISEVSQIYLEQYPHLAVYASQLAVKIGVLYKYAWYHSGRKGETTSWKRFLEWHIAHLLAHRAQYEEDTTPQPCQREEWIPQILDRLQELCQKMVPFIPFDRSFAKTLVEQNTSFTPGSFD